MQSSLYETQGTSRCGAYDRQSPSTRRSLHTLLTRLRDGLGLHRTLVVEIAPSATQPPSRPSRGASSGGSSSRAVAVARVFFAISNVGLTKSVGDAT